MQSCNRLTLAMTFALFVAQAGHASSVSLSFTGNLATPELVLDVSLNVGGTGAQSVVLKSWDFGGGTNAQDAMISSGGFDGLLAVFAGSAVSAPIVTDNGNPAGTSDNLSNYTTGYGTGLPGDNLVGCPPAGTILFSNGDTVCGDITMALSLAPGTYTVLLPDWNYIPNAIFDNGTLGEGFADFTGGAPSKRATPTRVRR